MAFAFYGSNNDQTVTQRVARMSSDAQARRLVSSHNLNIVNVSWDDCARNKMSCWGPCISDMTLQVGTSRMPVIREPNFTDKTWDVPVDKIPIRIGNEKPEGQGAMSTIPLSEYLKNFSDHISKPPAGGKINLLVEDGAKPDRHVVMSSQACFLPIEEGDQTKFNVALYNYQSKPDNPAVLVIVSTSKGTSAQIVTGGDQKLLFNDHGKKADFAGQRLRDNRRERGVALDGEMSQQEKQDNVIVVIQVPLVHREPPRSGFNFGGGSQWGQSGFGDNSFGIPGGFAPAAAFGGGGGFGSTFAPAAPSGFGFGSNQSAFSSPQLECRSFVSKKRSVPQADVVAAIVRVAPRTEVTCTCKSVLTKRKAWSCYDGNGVNCDTCRVAVRGDQWVYHCEKGKFYQHRNGYDLCEACGNKQLEFDECAGRRITRDRRYPIRVTLQYYKGTANGVMNADIMNEIASQLAASRNQAEAVGSLVTEVTNRTTEPVLGQSAFSFGTDEYREVKNILSRVNLMEYLTNFRSQEVNDESLGLLEPHHISALISKIGHRARFEAELKRWKEQRNGAGNWMNGFLG